MWNINYGNTILIGMDILSKPSMEGTLTDDESDEEIQLQSNELFDDATKHVRTIIGTLSSDDLLFFYGRYKQATVGPCNVNKPPFYAFQEKQKWKAWQDVGNMSKVCDLQFWCNFIV